MLFKKLVVKFPIEMVKFIKTPTRIIKVTPPVYVENNDKVLDWYVNDKFELIIFKED